jgi:hypothetical protein
MDQEAITRKYSKLLVDQLKFTLSSSIILKHLTNWCKAPKNVHDHEINVLVSYIKCKIINVLVLTCFGGYFVSPNLLLLEGTKSFSKDIGTYFCMFNILNHCDIELVNICFNVLKHKIYGI